VSAANVIEVDQNDFQTRVVEASNDIPVVVDFWAGWCQPCLVLGPLLERLAEDYAGRFVLAKVDVDANQELAARFRVQGIPAVKAFRDGQVASEFVGAQPEPVVRRFLDSIVPSRADELVASLPSDNDGAQSALRMALQAEPGHAGASARLARTLLDRGDAEAARDVLAAAASSPDVARLRAELELRDVASRGGELGAAARAALSGEHREALEWALAALGDGGDRDRSRELMVRLFELLGEDHELTREFRSRLASALF
jgi:putative thioredoxin